MNKIIRKALLRQLKKHCDAIGKERDALREMQDEIETQFASAESGLEALDSAIQTFSEVA